MDLILNSVSRTQRLAVVHEAHTFAGLGAEILAAVAESGIALLQAPLRIGAAESRIPAAPSLVSALLPNADSITEQLAARLSENLEAVS